VVAVVEQADERGDTERARHQHRLVVGVGGELAHLVQDRGRLAELGLGQAHVADKAVQVLDQRDQDLAQARIAGAFHDLQNGGRDVLLAFDEHVPNLEA
jgi:hypothetical protein